MVATGTKESPAAFRAGDRVRVRPDPVYSNRPHVGEAGAVERVRADAAFYPLLVKLDSGVRCCFYPQELEPEPTPPDAVAVRVWEDDGGRGGEP
jgi:hypothetical protein